MIVSMIEEQPRRFPAKGTFFALIAGLLLAGGLVDDAHLFMSLAFGGLLYWFLRAIKE